MRLETIQKRDGLNHVVRTDSVGAGSAHHEYAVVRQDNDEQVALIVFQHGARSDASSIHGVLDGDLLEIVRDRLKGFQSGEYATRENAIALTHIEEALLWMNKRAEDRAERGVLGTMQK